MRFITAGFVQNVTVVSDNVTLKNKAGKAAMAYQPITGTPPHGKTDKLEDHSFLTRAIKTSRTRTTPPWLDAKERKQKMQSGAVTSGRAVMIRLRIRRPRRRFRLLTRRGCGSICQRNYILAGFGPIGPQYRSSLTSAYRSLFKRPIRFSLKTHWVCRFRPRFIPRGSRRSGSIRIRMETRPQWPRSNLQRLKTARLSNGVTTTVSF